MRRLLTTAALAATAVALAAPAAHAADSCPNARFRTGAGSSLPDCRAWEQVTPQEKAGVNPASYITALTSEAGDRLFYYAAGSFGSSSGVPFRTGYASTRASAWSTLGTDAPQETVPVLVAYPTFAVSPDRTRVLVASRRKMTPDAENGASNVYARDTASGGYTLVVTHPGGDLYRELAGFDGPQSFVAGSPDFRHVLFSSAVALTPDATAGGRNVYQWDGGALRLLGLAPDGSKRQVTSGGLLAEQRAVSDDGRRVTYQASANGENFFYQQLDGGPAVLVGHEPGAAGSSSAPLPAGSGFSTIFASPDGERVTFQASTQAPDGTGPFYRWRARDGVVVDALDGVRLPANSSSPQLREVSPDGRFIWFDVNEPSATVSGDFPVSLYVFDSSTRRLERVLQFASTAENTLGGRYSPDGSKVVVPSTSSLTGYGNDVAREECRGYVGGPPGPCVELFTFDAAQLDAPLICVSCGTPGTSSVGNAASGITGTNNGQNPHTITDGGTVFFDTPQRLSPGDVNTLADAYEYVPGRGPSLLSSGKGSNPVTLGDASASGQDVFFFTGDSLVAQDDDQLVDAYDARVGGGIAAQQVAPARDPDPCPTGSCRAVAPAAPAPELPGTLAFRERSRPPVFDVAKVTKAARRAAAVSGRLAVSVQVGAAGRLSARAAARLGKRSVGIGRTLYSAPKAGRYKLRVTLSGAARRALARGGKLTISLSVDYSRASKPAKQSFSIAPRTGRSVSRGAK